MKTYGLLLRVWISLVFLCLSPAAKAQSSDYDKSPLMLPVISNVLAKEALNSLQIRLGDLRHMSNPQTRHGFWARGYAEDIDVSDFISADVTLFGGEAGYDYLLKNSDVSRLYVGVSGGFAAITDFKTARDEIDRYSDGDAHAPVVGVYAAWLHDNGWFADLTARYLWSSVKSTHYPYEENSEAKRDYFGATFEIGKELRHSLSSVSFLRIEPKMEWTYLRGEKNDFAFDPYTSVAYDTTDYLAGRAGVLLGYVREMKNGLKLEPFLEAGYTYAPKGKTDLRYFSNLGSGYLMQEQSDMTGSSWDVSLGVNWQLSKNLYLYARAGYENGSFMDKKEGRLGLRGTFGKKERHTTQTASKLAAASSVTASAPARKSVTTAAEPAADQQAPSLRFDNLALFPFNKVNVGAAYEGKIKDAARQIKESSYSRVVVTGHTDNIGSLEINNSVSLKRARNVAEQLQEHGVRGETLQTQGKAYLEPVADNKTSSGRAKNRRVDVHVW